LENILNIDYIARSTLLFGGGINKMKEVVIVSGVRAAQGKFAGQTLIFLQYL